MSSNCGCSADLMFSWRRSRDLVVRSLGPTRRRLAGGGPSLSESMEESAASGAGDPLCEFSCDGGGVGRLGSAREVALGLLYILQSASENCIPGGGDGVRLPQELSGDEAREVDSDVSSLDSGLSGWSRAMAPAEWAAENARARQCQCGRKGAVCGAAQGGEEEEGEVAGGRNRGGEERRSSATLALTLRVAFTLLDEWLVASAGRASRSRLAAGKECGGE